jgi:DNA-binding CsgD family transcriptional regulator
VGVEVTAQPEGIRLTPRERDILRLLADGLSDKEMAAELRMGRRTVSTHVATIRAKLDAPSRSAAAAIAVRDRLV